MTQELRHTLELRFSSLEANDDIGPCVLLFAALVDSANLGDSALALAKTHGLPAETACEVILQSFLFAGFPRCINGLESFRRHYTDEIGRGTGTQTTGADVERNRQRGEELFRRIYAQHSDAVLDALDHYHKELRDWIIVDAYGKILSRPGLSPRHRELCAVVGLLVSGDTRQLSSHMRGALNCGANVAEVRKSIKVINFLISSERFELANTVLGKVGS